MKFSGDAEFLNELNDLPGEIWDVEFDDDSLWDDEVDTGEFDTGEFDDDYNPYGG